MFARSVSLVAPAALAALVAGCATETADTAQTEEAAVTSTALEVGSLAGEFRYAGEVEAIGRLTVDVIDDRMADAASRLEALRRIGATCERKTSTTTRCHKLHPASAVPAASLAALGQEHAGVFATFGSSWGTPSLVTDGDSFKEWDVPVDGTSADGAFRLYKWRRLGTDLTKIVLPGRSTAEPLELVVRDASRLGRWARKVTTESRWRWHEDLGLVILAKR